jgi:hypothetical protein
MRETNVRRRERAAKMLLGELRRLGALRNSFLLTFDRKEGILLLSI